MDSHQNAVLTPVSRADLVRRVIDQRLAVKVVAANFGISSKTVSKWVRRFRNGGSAALVNRSSRPHHSPRLTSST